MTTRSATSGESAKGKAATAARKGATARPKPVAIVVPPETAAALAGDALPAVAGAEMKKKDLLDAVCARTDVKRKFVRPVVDAVIEILGEAIAEGRELNLQPLGKLVHKRSKETANARITLARIRQSKAAANPTRESAKESVADDED